MSESTLLIIGAAVVVLALVFIILARTGRKPSVPPIDAVLPDEPLSEPGAPLAAGLPGTPVAELDPLPPPIEGGPPDDLTRLKGLGPKAAAMLNSLGVTRYVEIASWNEPQVARIDAEMGAFKGRIVRDRWVEQARYLAADDIAGFEAVFGKLS